LIADLTGKGAVAVSRIFVGPICAGLPAGLAQLVEQLTLNQLVRGSSPRSSRSSFQDATLAQLVEQLICNHQVVGSIPTGGSILKKVLGLWLRAFFELSLSLPGASVIFCERFRLSVKDQEIEIFSC
jgi:hypothetical protein